MIRRIVFIFFILLSGCAEVTNRQIASFDTSDIANKVAVLLAQYQIPSTLSKTKDTYNVSVEYQYEQKARELLTDYNFYFEKVDLNDLLESKFASLSKLEIVKSNLLEGREIYNKLSILPNVFRVNVIVTGNKEKRVSVLLISLVELTSEEKSSIERFLKGVIADRDKLTISYIVKGASSNLVGDNES